MKQGVASEASSVIDKRGFKWCPNLDLNQGHTDFQSVALPTELFGHFKVWRVYSRGICGCPQAFRRKYNLLHMGLWWLISHKHLCRIYAVDSLCVSAQDRFLMIIPF